MRVEPVKPIETCPTCGAAVVVSYRARDDVWARLTPREREVVDHLVRLGSADAVAAELGLGRQTVKNQLASVRLKTGTKTMLQALYRILGG